MSSHHDTVRREFAKQAPTFEDPEYSFGDPRLMAWITKNVPAHPGTAVLDVAGGTGHVARAYAGDAAVAVVLDLSDEMLATGQGQAKVAGQRNVVFVRGDAGAMGFVDDAFDLVFSRFAVHHFEHPEEQIGEMVRVCRPGGRVAIIDLVAADPSLAANHDRLERMRDPSHTRALPMDELRTLLEQAGADVVHETFHDQRLPAERWLDQAAPPAEAAEAIRAELRDELDRGAPTGLRPLIEDGELHVMHRYAIVVASPSVSAPR
jgi:ubiquinone/menaquinone biosynthesis C-methylase UbiE